jgi:hypothetical protein
VTDFENWFSSDFIKALHQVKHEPGVLSSGHTLENASWDRRAAYLLWCERGRPAATWVEQTRALREKPPTVPDDLAALLG